MFHIKRRLIFSSDIDLIVHSKDRRPWRPEELEAYMLILRDAFCRHRICTQEGIQIINGATVPIIKLTDRRTEVKVDMSFNMNNGVRSAQLILHYLEVYPSLKYLVYVLKQYLLQLNLNEVWTGGISSYSLILMLVCFFQSYYKKDQHSFWSSSLSSTFLSGLPTSTIKTSSKPISTTDDGTSSTSYPSSSAASCTSSDDNNSCNNNNSDLDDEHFTHLNSNSTSTPIEHANLGHMLISFLELYGVYFNYAKLGIRVQTPDQPDRPAGFIDKEELFKNFCCGHRTISNLCIVDPFNEKNDISKASWLTPKLNSAFREAFDKLLQSVSDQNATLKNAPSILSKILSVSESTLIYRKRLRSIYRDNQNEQRTVRQIHHGRMNYTPMDKPLIQYPNGHSLKYPYHVQFQQQFYTSHHVYHRPQAQRTNHQRSVDENQE